MTRDLPGICRLVTGAKRRCHRGDRRFRDDANRSQRRRFGARAGAAAGAAGRVRHHGQPRLLERPQRGQIVQERCVGAYTPVQTLINQTHVWERNGARLHLAGYDDFWAGAPDFDGVAAQIPAREAAIALGHEPDFAIEVAALDKFGLMLSGHSHGGQIALPGGIPIHVPTYAHKFPRGWYDVNGMRLYTNRGLGTVGVPLRFCSRPEISVFTLRV